jgi:hypothetical protein
MRANAVGQPGGRASGSNRDGLSVHIYGRVCGRGCRCGREELSLRDSGGARHGAGADGSAAARGADERTGTWTESRQEATRATCVTALMRQIVQILAAVIHAGKEGPSLQPIGYTWSHLACRTGHLVAVWQPFTGPHFIYDSERRSLEGGVLPARATVVWVGNHH